MRKKTTKGIGENRQSGFRPWRGHDGMKSPCFNNVQIRQQFLLEDHDIAIAMVIPSLIVNKSKRYSERERDQESTYLLGYYIRGRCGVKERQGASLSLFFDGDWGQTNINKAERWKLGGFWYENPRTSLI
jgi:hypothetical protein